ncbi:MAG: HD domain-containing protein [Clostridia bacterium]|nr:HD domain-containing protein [Clostridia bacterium]
MDFENLKKAVLQMLSKELRPNLYYHDINHTLDVYHSAQRLAELEGIGEDDLLLIKTAALLHDSGMLNAYDGHEAASCNIAREMLPRFGYTDDYIHRVCRMIHTTQLPQSAVTLSEKILCDADLDYLGREDFFMIAHRLRVEWNMQKVRVTTLREWYELQVKFLEAHTYFTPSARDTRSEGKQKNLNQIKEILCINK